MNKSAIASTLLCLGLAASNLLAQEAPPPGSGRAPETPPPTREPEERELKDAPLGQEKQAAKLAEKYALTVEEVRKLRDSGLGWGEVRHALDLSKASGKPVSEIMKLYHSGMGWGKIAQELGLKLGDAAGKDRGEKRRELREKRVERPEERRSERREHRRGRGLQRGRGLLRDRPLALLEPIPAARSGPPRSGRLPEMENRR